VGNNNISSFMMENRMGVPCNHLDGVSIMVEKNMVVGTWLQKLNPFFISNHCITHRRNLH